MYDFNCYDEQTKILITLFLFVKNITMAVESMRLAFLTLAILLTKILVLNTKKIRQITSHSCHQENEEK